MQKLAQNLFGNSCVRKKLVYFCLLTCPTAFQREIVLNTVYTPDKC